ncbi:2OG-Fe(II) oxygenase superfamily protein [Burkholderia sp. D7]|nr:2OG-Fe(II) oxygenase superfamily protein [Burkholderia sp. D7]
MKIFTDTSGRISAKALQTLTDDQFQVLRIKGFYGKPLCDKAADALISSPLLGPYKNAPDISHVGESFFEAVLSQHQVENYLGQSRVWIEQVRAAMDPMLSPIDKVRLQLDELWPAGAQLARLMGRPMFAGLMRLFQNSAGAEPHIDNAGWDAESVGLSAEVASPIQLALNIYLRVPEEKDGGALLLHEHRPNRDDYDARKLPDSYGLRIDDLPPPVRIRPEVGELILFDSRRIHEVEPSRTPRATASMFIKMSGPDRPLELFS